MVEDHDVGGGDGGAVVAEEAVADVVHLTAGVAGQGVGVSERPVPEQDAEVQGRLWRGGAGREEAPVEQVGGDAEQGDEGEQLGDLGGVHLMRFGRHWVQ
ncbi:hypothetical protein NHX12_028789 [Muraenolepis orangiensis]|uniref:Uncharacterized protein n=1 Tax=Muraenolepis orangiensis TaxID=630683 RepID=A0A9Q0IN23_9TELE|nr:hypothetical protein NHX12_028789 [Muraenolepis orangiensis]